RGARARGDVAPAIAAWLARQSRPGVLPGSAGGAGRGGRRGRRGGGRGRRGGVEPRLARVAAWRGDLRDVRVLRACAGTAGLSADGRHRADLSRGRHRAPMAGRHGCLRPRAGARHVLALRHAVASAAAARPVRLLMLDVLHNLALAFSVALSPAVLFYAFIGCVIGTLVGVLPGVGPLAGISLLLPATFGMDATRAIVMLAGIYYGAMYGGSTTSILMRIPGEA